MAGNDLTIETRIRIAAPRDVVWEYLTGSEHVPRWLGCLRYEKSLGHIFYMQQDAGKRAAGDIDGATHCRIVTLDEPRTFEFTWFLPGTPETTVSLGLAEVGAETDVILTHTGWEQFDAAAIREIRDALANGWKSSVLPNLRTFVESNG